MEIVIEDNGVGISKENQDKLFKDYSRLDEHQNVNEKGTGLGLSICKNLVEKMGGKVRVESILGEGSKFIITNQFRCVDKVIYHNKPNNSLSNLDKVQIFHDIKAFEYTENFH